jgi:DNA-directed RNA polymerase subunit RPC12/RpoP
MKYYHCGTCNEPHAILEESDMVERIVECDTNGHVKNCVTEPRHNDGKHYHCAYCGRYITKEQHDFARAKP